VILDDADLERAVVNGIQKCYLNSGQTCSALTRMLVPREKLEIVEQIAAAAVAQTRVGDPFAETTQLGPLVSGVQRDRVRGYIETGLRRERSWSPEASSRPRAWTPGTTSGPLSSATCGPRW
jgi:aldehyde dehydrogenase (NAD+)